MYEHAYKKVEITGSSAEGTDQAIQNAIAKAGKTLHNMAWFEVVEIRGHLVNNAIAHWQVTIKIGFRLED